MAVLAACIVGTLGAVQASADMTWADELANSLAFYKSNYPNSNWEPYARKLTVVKNALKRGDQKVVKTEMTKWFKMLRNREYGITDVAADELYNFAAIITPLQEYGISVPASGLGQ
jgi:hypothetical protein